MPTDNKPPSDHLQTSDLKCMVNAMAVELPVFYPSDPVSWFQRAEGQFGVRSITQDEMKFWYVLSALDAKTSTRASRVIARLTKGTKYELLKDFLIRTYNHTGSMPNASSLPQSWETGNLQPSPTNYTVHNMASLHTPKSGQHNNSLQEAQLHLSIFVTWGTVQLRNIGDEQRWHSFLILTAAIME